MTRYAQLRQWARPRFTEELKSWGFDVSKHRLQYWRNRGDILHGIVFDMNVAQTRSQIRLVAWIESMADPTYPYAFPQNVRFNCTRDLVSDGIVEYENPSWLVETREQAEQTFAQSLPLIVEYGLPWFETVNDHTSILANLNRDVSANLRVVLTERILNPQYKQLQSNAS